MIVEKRMVAVEEHLYCEQCNGEMTFSKMEHSGDHISYIHECLHCGYSEVTKHQYPRISTRYEEES